VIQLTSFFAQEAQDAIDCYPVNGLSLAHRIEDFLGSQEERAVIRDSQDTQSVWGVVRTADKK
jgi:hypothetical protein